MEKEELFRQIADAVVYHQTPALRVLEMYGNSNVVLFYASWDNICY